MLGKWFTYFDRYLVDFCTPLLDKKKLQPIKIVTFLFILFAGLCISDKGIHLLSRPALIAEWLKSLPLTDRRISPESELKSLLGQETLI